MSLKAVKKGCQPFSYVIRFFLFSKNIRWRGTSPYK